jgi:cyclophilin family peptidyl-prolyl cis-trans isomerase
MTPPLRSCAFAHSRIRAFVHFAVLRFCVSVFRVTALALVFAALSVHGRLLPLAAQPVAPLIVVETTKGTFAFDTYPLEAPKSVAHIVALVKAGFYDGQRIHRAVPAFVVQFGDPQTRDLDKRTVWGKGAEASSGTPIGVAEVTLKRTNIALAVGLAHMGEPAQADSQLYIMLVARPELDGQYAVVGQVVEGGDVPSRLQVGDQILRVYVRE